VAPGYVPDVVDDVIVVEFRRSKATVVDSGGFPAHDVISTTCQDDSEADDENEARGNRE